MKLVNICVVVLELVSVADCLVTPRGYRALSRAPYSSYHASTRALAAELRSTMEENEPTAAVSVVTRVANGDATVTAEEVCFLLFRFEGTSHAFCP